MGIDEKTYWEIAKCGENSYDDAWNLVQYWNYEENLCYIMTEEEIACSNAWNSWWDEDDKCFIMTDEEYECNFDWNSYWGPTETSEYTCILPESDGFYD